MSQIVANAFLAAALIFLVGLSFGLVYHASRVFHVAQAGVMAVSAYIAFELHANLGLSLWSAVGLAVLTGAILGTCCERLVYRPIRLRFGNPLRSLIASIGAYTVMENVISLIWGDEARSFSYARVEVGHSLGGAYLTSLQLVIISVALVAGACASISIRFSDTGRSLRAIATNVELATIYGIDSNAMILRATVLGSMVASIAAVLMGLDTNISPSMGFRTLVEGMVAVMVAGSWSPGRLASASIILAGAEQAVAYLWAPRWMDAVAYTVLILLLALRPGGRDQAKLAGAVV